MSARLSHSELDEIEDALSRAPGCPDPTRNVCKRIASGNAAWARARALLERLPAPMADLASDCADYERRWLEECRAHGETQRLLMLAHHELGDHSLCGGDCEVNP